MVYLPVERRQEAETAIITTTTSRIRPVINRGSVCVCVNVATECVCGGRTLESYKLEETAQTIRGKERGFTLKPSKWTIYRRLFVEIKNNFWSICRWSKTKKNKCLAVQIKATYGHKYNLTKERNGCYQSQIMVELTTFFVVRVCIFVFKGIVTCLNFVFVSLWIHESRL